MNMVLQCTFQKNLAMIPFDHVKNVRIRPCDLSDCGPKALERIREGLETYKPRVLGKNFGELLELAHKLRLAGIDKETALKQVLAQAGKPRKE